MVKSYEITAINDIGEEVTGLAERVTDGEEKHSELDGRVSRGESAQMQIATQVIDNKNAIDELRITKGSVSKYVVKQVNVGVATRNGELIVDNAMATDVTFISFAPFDVNGQSTKPIQTGDIIEFIEAAARNIGDVTRYRVKDAPNQQSVSVEYLAGNNDFVIDEPEECYIYPQNEETASVEYADAQDALLQDQVNNKVNLSGTNEITSPWKIKTDSKTYISANTDELKLYHVADPTNQDDGWAANKGYVDTQDALKVNKAGDTYSGYLDFEAHGGGARFFRGSDKYFSVWSFQVDETRCRINPGKDFKLTGYAPGDDVEKQLLWWDQANDALHVKRLADPANRDDAAPMGYVDDRVAECEAGLTDYVDQQLEGLDFDTDVDLDGYIKSTGDSYITTQWRIKTENKTFISITTNEMKLYNVADPTGHESHWAANKAYVDKHLKLTGGDVSGVMNISGSGRIRGLDADGNEKIKIYPGGQIDTKDVIKVNRSGSANCYEAKDNNTIKFSVKANGQAISKYNISSSSSNETLTTKKYVDHQWLAPARLAWKWGGNVSSSADPGEGNFVWHPGGSGDIIGYMRMSFLSSNGCDISDGKFNDTNVTFSYGPVGTIWQWRSDTGKWKLIMQVRIQTWRWNFNNHFEFGLSSTHGRNFSDLASDAVYYMTVGGFF